MGSLIFHTTKSKLCALFCMFVASNVLIAFKVWTISVPPIGFSQFSNKLALPLMNYENPNRVFSGKVTTTPRSKEFLNSSQNISLLSPKKIEVCDDLVKFHNEDIVAIADVTIDPKYATGKQGGENISTVLNQSEKSEYYQLKSGFIQLNCNGYLKCAIGRYNARLREFCPSISYGTSNSSTMIHNSAVSKATAAIIRKDYANLYWTMVDIYDIFQSSVLLGIPPNNLTVLWVDGHPASHTDALWTTLFGKVIRLGSLKEPLFSNQLLFGTSTTLANVKSNPSNLESFRSFILERFNLPTERKLNCSRINVLIIWRRDYVAHPRNPSGKISRKIANEVELLETISKQLPEHSVVGVQLDALPVHEQLKMTSSADVLIGMHGAGLSNTLVIPKHSALIEMFPKSHSIKSHFQYIAKWRGLLYRLWKNERKDKEKDSFSTIVNARVVAELVKDSYHKMCSNETNRA